ncbi:unnamed protein product [Prorocentrum cordatum]|uniref:Uncharacterized protein n=1 Tax=Prorocentrum cordatum TaxID=2364126 RepID=A0ABN9XJH4_9DINO|nr:unnamed protein product [Polarella glacialis]
MLQGRRQEFGVVAPLPSASMLSTSSCKSRPPTSEPGLLQPPAELRQRQQPVAVRVQRRVDAPDGASPRTEVERTVTRTELGAPQWGALPLASSIHGTSRLNVFSLLSVSEGPY